jgi:hypothetical protein
MLLSVGVDAALALEQTLFFNQLHPNPTLLSNGSDVVERWDGCCSGVGAGEFFNQLHPNPTLLSNGSDVVE